MMCERAMMVLVLSAVCSANGAIDDGVPACSTATSEARVWLEGAGSFDPATGRDLRNYPPHRVADFTDMRLDIVIPDMDVARLEAVETLTFKPIAEPLRELALDAHLMAIQSVSCDTAATKFSYDERTLTISFDPPLAPDVPVTIVTTYAVEDPAQGLIWTPSSPAWPGRAAQLHSQGEPETNSYWFPCHDFPNERLTTELVVTVPRGYLVSSNGRLESRGKVITPTADTPAGDYDLEGHETFHWVQDKAHPNYLVTLVVGKFDVVDVGSKKLPMPVYVAPGEGKNVRGTFGRTPEMISLFEKLLDEKYPWDQYAQVLVWNFGAGGMENTSATTLFGTAVLSEAARRDQSMEGLISHELGHQWFGDLLTCRSWEHIWLNEGFATYMEVLWFEHVDGQDGYQNEMIGNFDSLIGADKPAAPGVPGMVSKVYEHPWDVFDRAANPYPKGASILHMLRMKLGDDVFFRAMSTYVDRFKGKSVETADLRKVFEEVSGEALASFFDQWCVRPGLPTLEVDIDWDAAARRLSVHVEQTQPIDGYNPAYEFDLPLWIHHPGAPAGGRLTSIHVDSRETEATFDLPGAPSVVAVNADLSVLADIHVDQPQVRWESQLDHGPTLASKVQAARHLASSDDPAVPEHLAVVARDSAHHDRLRKEAIESLAKLGALDQLVSLLEGGMPDPQVRETLVQQVATALKEAPDVDPALGTGAGEAIAEMARTDPSEPVRAACVRAIGSLGQAAHRSVVVLATETDSQHDRIRQAGLDAMGDLDTAGGLEAAIGLAQPGHPDRTRAKAVETIAKLAHHDPERAFGALTGLLNDRERRVWEAAGRALIELGDQQAIEELDALGASRPDPADKAMIGEWRNDLAAKASK